MSEKQLSFAAELDINDKKLYGGFDIQANERGGKTKKEVPSP
jgi:hypothetical protein